MIFINFLSRSRYQYQHYNFIVTIMLTIIIIMLIVGCVPLNHSTDHRDMKTIILFPVINNTDNKIIKKDYFSEYVLIPQEQSIRLSGEYTVNSSKLSDIGYVVIYASRVGIDPITRKELIDIRKRNTLDKLKLLPYDYAVIMSFDSFESSDTKFTRKLIVSSIIYDVKSGKIAIEDQYNHTAWRGIIEGPLSLDSESQDIIYKEIGDAYRTHLFNCLLKLREQK